MIARMSIVSTVRCAICCARACAALCALAAARAAVCKYVDPATATSVHEHRGGGEGLQACCASRRPTCRAVRARHRGRSRARRSPTATATRRRRRLSAGRPGDAEGRATTTAPQVLEDELATEEKRLAERARDRRTASAERLGDERNYAEVRSTASRGCARRVAAARAQHRGDCSESSPALTLIAARAVSARGRRTHARRGIVLMLRVPSPSSAHDGVQSLRFAGSTCSRPRCCCSTTSACPVRQSRRREPVRAVARATAAGATPSESVRRAARAVAPRSAARAPTSAATPSRSSSSARPASRELHLPCTVSPIDRRRDATLLLEFRHIDQQLQDRARGAPARAAAGQPRADPQPRARDQESARRHPRRGAAARAELRARSSTEYTQVIISEADRLQALVDRLLAPHRLPHVPATSTSTRCCERVRSVVQAEFPASLASCATYDIAAGVRGDPRAADPGGAQHRAQRRAGAATDDATRRHHARARASRGR